MPAHARDEDVDSAIEYREQLISRLRQIVDLACQVEGKTLGVIAREFVNISNDLREVGVKCVEKIIAWTFRNTPPNSVSPARYLYPHDEEYLCKMLHDLDFVTEKLPDKMRSHGNFATGDPCFVSKHTSNNAVRRAAVGATLVVLDAVARQTAYNNSRASLSRRSFSSNLNRSKSQNEFSPANTPMANSRAGAFLVPMEPTEEDCDPVEQRRGARTDLALDDAEVARRKKAAIDKLDPHAAKKKRRHQKKEINIFRGKYLYRRGDLLGEGAYAKVYECDRQDGRRFAVKIFEPPVDDEDEATYEYRRICLGREIRLLKNMRHPNIIEYEESLVYKKSQTHIVMEKMACPLMKVSIDRNPNAKIKVLDTAYMPQHGTSLQLAAYAVVTQLLNAVAFLHSNHVIHRDIKPDNVLATVSPKGFVVKLADFGSARELPTAVESYPDLTNYVGSRCYRAPEVLGQNTSYGMHADIWAVGCTMAEFLNGTPLFQGETEQDVLDSILTYKFQMNMGLRREIESRGLSVGNQSKKPETPELATAFEPLITSNLIKEAFVSSLCEKVLCIAELDRYSAKELYRFYMAMSSDTTVPLPPGLDERDIRGGFGSDASVKSHGRGGQYSRSSFTSNRKPSIMSRR